MGPNQSVKPMPQPLQYSVLKRRLPWKPYLLGVMTLPTLYFTAYLLLRVTGVYYPYWNQGGWDIDGSTRSYLLDALFVPATLLEARIQNELRWLREPTGV